MRAKKQVLVVEDNELNRAMLCEIFSDTYQVLEAGNGLEALDILQQRKGGISLILLDVMMPVMDGYTFLDRIKSDAELALIPVIVMTQNDTEEDELTALTHGATDFIPKPYRPQVLLHRVANLIKLCETAAEVNQLRYDRLTGLYTKEFFFEKVREQLEQHPERNYSLICANVENFKLFNDTFGIKEGDRLLIEIADAFRALIGKEAICCRYRADRFLFLQEHTPEYHRRMEFGKDGRYCNITRDKNVVMKWGIYAILDPTIPVELMCDRVLLAMECIKGQYDQNYAVYEGSLREKLLRENAIIEAMETALIEKQFQVYFQPKYSLNENCIAGAEALVRWEHPELGLMFPGDFIPLFEKNGFIRKLDRYVWERVCAHLRDWREKGYPLLPVSVNVSRADMYQSDLAETFSALTQKYGVDPKYLHLEITESAYAGNPNQIVSTVEKLRKLGFIIEMDDFGSGYSSLNMLSQMKLDVLKLDMKFVQNEISKPAEMSVLNDTIMMAHRLHLSVVAEGVETREQVYCLRKMGCDYAQGYFFAKPVPAAEYEELLQKLSDRSAKALLKTPWIGSALRRILVADEDVAFRERVRQSFEGQCDVLEAPDADSALAGIHSGEYDGICAVILSLTLPENGAVRLFRALRKEPALWEIPVLATVPNGKVMEELPLARETDDLLCKCHPMFDLRRRIRYLIDVVAFRERETALRDEANRDYLTGLLNRRGLQTAMAAIRKEEQPLAVCLFDLDNLKKVNDTCGHDTGDRMIMSFAELLRRQTRAEDIQCRYGGDEFVVIMKHMKDGEAALKKAEEICRAFRINFADEAFPASCSMGVAMCAADERPSAELIKRADQALYRAKRENKGSVFLWSGDES